MVKFLDAIQNISRPYTQNLFIISIVLLFAFVSYYGYNRFYKNNLEGLDTLDVANASASKPTTIMFFHADWCPHCKKAEPVWNDFVASHGDKINGHTVEFKDVDCTDDKDPTVNSLITKYNVESYPTIKMAKGKDVIDFDSRITPDTLDAFVNELLQST